MWFINVLLLSVFQTGCTYVHALLIPHGITFRGMIDAESISKQKIAKEIAIQTICIHNKVIVLDKYTEKNIDIDRTYLRSNVFKNRAGSDSLRN